MSSDLQQLPPSLREKQRYIIFELLSDEHIAFGELVDPIWESALDVLGERGVAEVDMWILKDLYDTEERRGGIRVQKEHVEDVRAALTLLTAVNGEDVTVNVLGVTGTMYSARKKYF